LEDIVNSPSHYTSDGDIECWQAIKAQMSREQWIGYLRGNVQKYLWRFDQKGSSNEDYLVNLQKGKWYYDKLIGEYDSDSN